MLGLGICHLKQYLLLNSCLGFLHLGGFLRRLHLFMLIVSHWVQMNTLNKLGHIPLFICFTTRFTVTCSAGVPSNQSSPTLLKLGIYEVAGALVSTVYILAHKTDFMLYLWSNSCSYKHFTSFSLIWGPNHLLDGAKYWVLSIADYASLPPCFSVLQAVRKNLHLEEYGHSLKWHEEKTRSLLRERIQKTIRCLLLNRHIPALENY